MAANAQDVKPTHKNLYHIVQGPGRQRSWRKFGAGFVNSDGSINIVIDLFPGAHFQLRDPNQPEAPAGGSSNGDTKKKTYTINRSKATSKRKR